MFDNFQKVYYLPFEEFKNDDQNQFFLRLGAVKDKLIIIDLSQGNCGKDTAILYHKVLADLKLKFLIMSFDPRDHQVEPDIFYYPYWQINLLKNINKNIIYSNNRIHKISCPNKNPRPHRILNYILLKNKPFFKDILFTIQNAPDHGTYRPDDIVLSQHCIEEWESCKDKLQIFTINNYMQIDDPIWSDSYVNFVTEHTVTQSLFISEKTWKPIASEQLFLIFGNTGIVSYLREIGVDTFDDIIDHDYYDKINDTEDRLHRLHAILEHVMSLDLSAIFIQTAERRRRNRTNFLNGQFTKNYTDTLTLKIQEMLDFNAKQF